MNWMQLVKQTCISKSFTTFASQFICDVVDNCLDIKNISVKKMRTILRKSAKANRAKERKEFAGKAQMPEVLRGSLTTILSS